MPRPTCETHLRPVDGTNLADYDNVMTVSIFKLSRRSFDAIIAAYDWFGFIRLRDKPLPV